MFDSVIRRYESGRGNPTVDTLQRIATALGVSVNSLIGWDEPTDPMLPSEFNDFERFIESQGYYIRLEGDHYRLHKGQRSVPITVSELQNLVQQSKATVGALVQFLMEQKQNPPHD